MDREQIPYRVRPLLVAATLRRLWRHRAGSASRL